MGGASDLVVNGQRWTDSPIDKRWSKIAPRWLPNKEKLRMRKRTWCCSLACLQLLVSDRTPRRLVEMEVSTAATYSQWQEVMSKTRGTTYYYNPKTGECLWHLPAEVKVSPPVTSSKNTLLFVN